MFEDLTLIIPAKKEQDSLPVVLKELKKFNLKSIVILEQNDVETIEAIKDLNGKILYQKNKGYGDALINGINSTQTEFFVFLMQMDHSIQLRSIKCIIKQKMKIMILYLDLDILKMPVAMMTQL